MCVFPLLLQLALADTYLGSLSLSSFGSRRPLALTMAGSSGCGGPRATPGLGQSRHFDRAPLTSGLPRSTDIVRPAQLVRFVPKAVIGRHLAYTV
jgi:hypothetical protein